MGGGVSQAGGNRVGTQARGDSTMGRQSMRLRSSSQNRSGDRRSRHGSMQRDDEPRSASRRARSRDHTLLRRRDPDLAGLEADVRLTPAGPQETLDWLQALETVYGRIEVLERNQSLHAGTMSHTEVKLTSMTGKIKQPYEYLDGRVDGIQDSTNSRMKLASDTITNQSTQVTDQIAIANLSFLDLESQMQLLMRQVESLAEQLKGPDMRSPLNYEGRSPSQQQGAALPPQSQAYAQPLAYSVATPARTPRQEIFGVAPEEEETENADLAHATERNSAFGGQPLTFAERQRFGDEEAARPPMDPAEAHRQRVAYEQASMAREQSQSAVAEQRHYAGLQQQRQSAIAACRMAADASGYPPPPPSCMGEHQTFPAPQVAQPLAQQLGGQPIPVGMPMHGQSMIPGGLQLAQPGFVTPPPRVARSPNPFSPIGQGIVNAPQQAFLRQQQFNVGHAPSFDIRRKKNDALKIFKGGLDDYELWHDRLVDHIARGHPSTVEAGPCAR